MSLTRGADTLGPLAVGRGDELERALLAGEVPIAIYGLGKVGLPMAAMYAKRTGNVIGVDIDQGVVSTVNDGSVPFDHEPGLGSLVGETVDDGSLEATVAADDAATRARIHIIIVPVGLRESSDNGNAPSWTPEGSQRPVPGSMSADLRALLSAVTDVATGLKPDDLVIVESTVPPRTTRSVVAPMLERLSSLDLTDFGVAFSPERIQSGRALTDLSGIYPKIVGGIDDASTVATARVYDALIDGEVISMSDATTAECVKLFEGVYRDVNIALANELAKASDSLGIDVLETIEAANTQPYCDIHAPGAGVGGHCIPVYPHLFSAAVDHEMPLIATARQVNDSMPEFIVQRTISELADAGIPIEEAAVAVLGATYRPGIPETSNSPAGPILEHLRAAGATVVVVDPHMNDATVFDAHRIELDQLVDFGPDALVVVTPHDEFGEYDWAAFSGVVIDCRDAVKDRNGRTYTVGRGRS